MKLLTRRRARRRGEVANRQLPGIAWYRHFRLQAGPLQAAACTWSTARTAEAAQDHRGDPRSRSRRVPPALHQAHRASEATADDFRPNSLMDAWRLFSLAAVWSVPRGLPSAAHQSIGGVEAQSVRTRACEPLKSSMPSRRGEPTSERRGLSPHSAETIIRALAYRAARPLAPIGNPSPALNARSVRLPSPSTRKALTVAVRLLRT